MLCGRHVEDMQRNASGAPTPLHGLGKRSPFLYKPACATEARRLLWRSAGAQAFALGKRTPKARFNLLMMAPLGMALPDSYSLMTEPFSEIAVASCAWLIFFAVRACCKAILKSCDTVACLKVSPFSSSFAAFGTCE